MCTRQWNSTASTRWWALMTRLESRLDNVVFRAGFVKTRRAARQMVSHGHVTVNGKRMNVPSYKVETGDPSPFAPKAAPAHCSAIAPKRRQRPKHRNGLSSRPDGFSATVKPRAERGRDGSALQRSDHHPILQPLTLIIKIINSYLFMIEYSITLPSKPRVVSEEEHEGVL